MNLAYFLIFHFRYHQSIVLEIYFTNSCTWTTLLLVQNLHRNRNLGIL